MQVAENEENSEHVVESVLLFSNISDLLLNELFDFL